MIAGRRGPSPALVVAAVMSWVPPVVLVVARLRWADVPARVPTHWGGAGVADGWGSSGAVFWALLVPGVVGALICAVLAVTLATDTTRGRAALAIGVVSAVTGAIAMAWFTMVLSAEGGAGALLPVFGALMWGGLVAAVCLLRREPASLAPQSATP
ncbi:DUF1648 domain-containing protein [Curtobacterium sp. ZW137]|uniref:DUF1648 domain-containing protein n=1 Tax=Curtobacterium sp. ZW137 TaxID=2485104 RepID=UPI000F4CAEC7|nr:DUF1648 domain-containing protein [Curtobacterium sp. ZW137]ROP58821.1 uncharacterized protein DUF1648 [Curtobacterium sp. ZW137]